MREGGPETTKSVYLHFLNELTEIINSQPINDGQDPVLHSDDEDDLVFVEY